MADAYAQRYVNALIQAAVNDPNAVEIVGEVGSETARPPHVSVFLQLGPGHFLGTTAGVSGRPAPLPVDRGLNYFELCALTSGHSAGLLRFLSDVAMFIVSTLSPMLYGSDDQIRARVAKGDVGGGAPPKPFLPYETIQVAKEERLLLIPRWSFLVPEGPPVDVVEPLPISNADWDQIGPLSLDDRAKWTKTLGHSASDRWKALFPKL